MALEEADTNRRVNNKALTTELLKEVIEEYPLVDVGVKTNNTKHTWFRKDFSGQSSRIHYIFCSIPMWAAQFSTTFSIFDHTYLEAVLNPARLYKQMTMKDFILGSGEYLIRSQDLLVSLLVPQ